MEVICSCATGHRRQPARWPRLAYTASNLKNGKISWQMAKLPVMKVMPD